MLGAQPRSFSMRALRLLGLATAVGLTRAQDTPSEDAHCAQGQFNWMFNSLNQDPCAVAQYLGGVCINGIYQIPPLATNQVYTGPSLTAANECRCNSVFYSLLSACAICQDGQTMLWDEYDRNCSAVSVGVFPAQIPAGTAVPHWAYIDVTTLGEFNATLAQQLNGPESTAGPQPTAASSLTPSSTHSASSSPHDSTIIGPIIGGVVGGVAFLALLSLAVMLLLRRRRQLGASVKLMPTTLYPGELLSEDKGANLYRTQSHGPLLYDPSDPRTFPPTPTPLWSRAAVVSTENVTVTTTGSTHSSGPGQSYTGVPELSYTGVPEL
ncbi:hypothetical protein AX14_003625 [Amanita brunnescens Koide BX004]|nr:hypothetical protein AX14_003625 [Amanita brunnescens Koide BX004]